MMFLLLLALAIPAFADFTQADSAKANAYCKGGFWETTVSVKNKSEANAKAKAKIAGDLISLVESRTDIKDTKKENIDGRLETSSGFEAASNIKSSLTLLGFQELSLKQIENSEYELKAYICIKDLAKPYIDRQRELAETMEMAFATAKKKSEAWRKIQANWNEFMGIQTLLEVLGVESQHLASAKKAYEKAKEDYNKLCTAKLHWNPEKKNAYSDIAFAKLSGIEMEKSECKKGSSGISLIYKGEKPECKTRGGPYGCSYQPSLLISSCNGTELRLLESPAPVKGFDEIEENAVKKLQSKLKTEEFWNEWEQEIKQRSPQCE